MSNRETIPWMRTVVLIVLLFGGFSLISYVATLVEAARGGGTGAAPKGDRVLRAPSTAPLAAVPAAPRAPAPTGEK